MYTYDLIYIHILHHILLQTLSKIQLFQRSLQNGNISPWKTPWKILGSDPTFTESGLWPPKSPPTGSQRFRFPAALQRKHVRVVWFSTDHCFNQPVDWNLRKNLLKKSWKWITQKNKQKENMLERSRKRNEKNMSARYQFSYFQILSKIHGGLGLIFTQCFWLQGLIPKQHILEAEKGSPFSKEKHLQSITDYPVLGSISVFGKGMVTKSKNIRVFDDPSCPLYSSRIESLHENMHYEELPYTP